MIPFEMREGWLGAPQFAIAIFAGSVIKQKRWAFALPVFSMLISDIFMQVMHYFNPSLMPGFYSGQFSNYLLVASLTVIGFFISSRKPAEIGAGILAAPTVYFLLSNFIVWAGNGGWQRSKNLWWFNAILCGWTTVLPHGFFRNTGLGLPVFWILLPGDAVKKRSG
jgi:hypothetical protein